jgi:hypothetical protein
MNDVVRDWRRWSYGERVAAVLLVVGMIAVAVSSAALSLS